MVFCKGYIREAAKKSFVLSGRATKREGGLNGCATKEKRLFFNVKKKVPMATKPRGGGLKAIVAGPLKKTLFAASLKMCCFFLF